MEVQPVQEIDVAMVCIHVTCDGYLRQAHHLSHNLYNNNVKQYTTIYHGIRCNYILDFNTNHLRNEQCTPWSLYLGEERMKKP